MNKAKRLLRAEWKSTEMDFILYIRDLDAAESNTTARQLKENWFAALDGNTNSEGILLLNIYELEALILADITTFNKIYSTKINFGGDPMKKSQHKEYLKRKTRKNRRRYKESDTPELFKQMDINSLIKTCRYFSTFIKDLITKL
ncbi:MAG: DUF4276 family protein [Tunicatimonas sp.]